MIFDILTGLNGIPLCNNVFPINLERKSFNKLKQKV